MVKGLAYSKINMRIAPARMRLAVTVIAILLCKVKCLKIFLFFGERLLTTRRTSHHTIYPRPPRIISAEVTMLIKGFVAKSQRLFSVIMSIPALQKAEIELTTDIQIPYAPNSGTNTNIYRTAPIPSMISVPNNTFFTNLTRPDMVLRLKAS